LFEETGELVELDDYDEEGWGMPSKEEDSRFK